MPNLLDVVRPDLMPPRELIERPVNELLDLRGRCVAVTGGHGPNIGQAIVNRLAGIGASVALIHRPHSAEAARTVAAQVAERWGVVAVPVEGDMRDWDSAHAAAHRVLEELGGLDVWVNSAGAGRYPMMDRTTGQRRGGVEFWEASQHLVDDSLSVLLQTIMYGTHAALSVMVPRGRGRIINIASASAFGAIQYQVCYGTMKAGVVAFTEFVANEIGPKGVTIVGVAPGIAVGPARIPEYADVDEASYENVRQVMERVSIGRASWPEESANMVAFLASDAGAYVHGTTVKVTGGR